MVAAEPRAGGSVVSTIVPVPVPLDVNSGGKIPLKVSGGTDVNLGMDTAVRASIVPRYDGPTQITPSQQTQVLETAGKMMTEDITVGKIPDNYGLITWDGSTLTVS